MRVGLDAIVGFPASTSAISALTDGLDRSMPDRFNSPAAVFSPPAEHLTYYVDVAFREGFWFGQFVDRSLVDAIVNRAYNTNSTSGSPRPKTDEMALVYAIAAIGESLDRSLMSPTSEADQLGWKG